MGMANIMKRAMVRVLRAAMPMRVYQAAHAEWSVWIATRGSRLPEAFASGIHYVNAGCGNSGRPGWVNIDLGRFPNVSLRWDLRRGLPDQLLGRVRGLFTEHMLEHLDYETGVPRFLRSVHDALVPGGVIRIVVPNAARYMQAYVAPGWERIAEVRGLSDDGWDIYTGTHFRTKMELVNEVFRQGGGHLYAWDAQTLCLALERAGFVDVTEREFMQGHDPALLLDMPLRRSESLYVEGRRAPEGGQQTARS